MLRHQKAIGVITSILGFLFGGGVVTLAVKHYVLEPRTLRQTTSRGYAARFDGPELKPTRQAENAFWQTDVGTHLDQMPREKFKDRELQRKAIADAVAANATLHDIVYMLARFYREAGRCVQRGECDGEVLCNTLGKQPENFESVYRFVLATLEKRYGEEFAAPIESLGGVCRSHTR